VGYERRARVLETRARRPDHHHRLQLSESGSHPLPRSGVRSGVGRELVVSGRNERRPPGCPGGLHETHVVTWLQCRTSRTRIELDGAIDATHAKPHGWCIAAPAFGTGM